MLHQILEKERVIAQVFHNNPRTTRLKPWWQDTEVMELIANCFSLKTSFSDFTDILLAEEHVTASCLKPL